MSTDNNNFLYAIYKDQAQILSEIMTTKKMTAEEAVEYVLSMFNGPEFTGDLNPHVKTILTQMACDSSDSEGSVLSDDSDDIEPPIFTRRVNVIGLLTGLTSRIKWLEANFVIYPVRTAADAINADDTIIRLLLPYINSEILSIRRLTQLIRNCLGEHGDALMDQAAGTYSDAILCYRDRAVRYYEFHRFFQEITDNHSSISEAHKIIDPIYPAMEDHDLRMPVLTCDTTKSSYPHCFQTVVNAVYYGLHPNEIEPALRVYEDMLDNGLDANRNIDQFVRADSGEIIYGKDWIHAKRWFYRTHGTEACPFDLDGIPSFLLIEDDSEFSYPSTSSSESLSSN